MAVGQNVDVSYPELKFTISAPPDLEWLKIWKVEFRPVYPIGGCLIVAAYNEAQAKEIAAATLTHTAEFEVKEVAVLGPGVIEYMSGDY